MAYKLYLNLKGHRYMYTYTDTHTHIADFITYITYYFQEARTLKLKMTLPYTSC